MRASYRSTAQAHCSDSERLPPTVAASAVYLLRHCQTPRPTVIQEGLLRQQETFPGPVRVRANRPCAGNPADTAWSY
jgi:hypothetical protein